MRARALPAHACAARQGRPGSARPSSAPLQRSTTIALAPTAAAKRRPRARAAHAACPAIEATCAPPHGAARRIPRSGLQRHGQPPWAGLPRVSLRSSPCALLCTPRWASPRHGGGACARQRGPAPRRAAPLPTPRVAGRRARGRLDKHHIGAPRCCRAPRRAPRPACTHAAPMAGRMSQRRMASLPRTHHGCWERASGALHSAGKCAGRWKESSVARVCASDQLPRLIGSTVPFCSETVFMESCLPAVGMGGIYRRGAHATPRQPGALRA